ncbi:MAG: metallophosphoesterase [Clostridia bacterium]|nr:metallophosphoesterase [Clostridia bacterium]
MNILKFIIILVVMLLVVGGTNYYLAKRCFQCVSFILPNIPLGAYITIFSIVILIMGVGFMRSLLPIPTFIKHILAALSSYLMGFCIYLFLFTVVVDFVLLVCRLFKLFSVSVPNVRFVSGIIIFVLATFTTIYGVCHAKQIKTVNYNVKVEEKNVNNNWNIVMISDLHLGAVGSENRLNDIVNKINELNPDLICIVGDFFDTDFNAIKNPQQAIDIFKQLKTKYGIYMCPGNHDSGKTLEQMKSFLDNCNIKVLEDEYTIINNEIVLVGRLDSTPIGGYGNLHRKDVDEVLSGISDNLPVIVMDHNPVSVTEYKDNVDLVLAGHTHKGQVFPGNLFTNLTYEVDYGYYRKDGNSPQVIVSSGVGTWSMPMRVGTNCEIVQIDLHTN